jgi:hypothetical protein
MKDKKSFNFFAFLRAARPRFINFFKKKIIPMRRFYIASTSVLIISILSTSAQGFEVALAWDPCTEPDIAGYILYAREDGSGSSYAQIEYYPLDEIDPGSPQCTVTAMESGVTYHFVVTAVNNEGTESGYSNEVSVLNGQAFASALYSDGGSGCFVSTASALAQARPQAKLNRAAARRFDEISVFFSSMRSCLLPNRHLPIEQN